MSTTSAIAETCPDLEQLEALLQRRLCGRVHDLRLLFRDHGLVLSGHARTYYAKQLAQHAAMEISGLSVSANEIAVR